MSELLIRESQIREALSGEGVEEIDAHAAKPGDVLVRVTELAGATLAQIYSVVELRGTCVARGACQTIYCCTDPILDRALEIKIIPDASPFDQNRYDLSHELNGEIARYRLLRILSPELLPFSSGEFSLPVMDIDFNGSSIDVLRTYLEVLLEPIKREWTALLARERVDMSERGLTFEFSFDDFSSDDSMFADKMAMSFGILCNAYAFGQCYPGNMGPNSFKINLSLRSGYEDKAAQALDQMLSRLIKVFKDRFNITVTVEKNTDHFEFILS